MAYLPVDFNLSDFGLFLPTKAAASFHARMKELGFTAVDSKGMMIYTRHDSRICAMIGKDMSLNFLQDFYDHTPGGTIYAILEKLCVTFGGTMVGMYSIAAAGKSWGVRISQGLNLSGRDDVGQREHVQEEQVTAQQGATPSPSGGPIATQPQTTQTATPANLSRGSTPVNSGQVGQGQPGQLAQSGPTAKEQQRDKLYQMLVEDQYTKFVAEHGGDDINKKLELIRAFNAQFPKEEEEPQAQASVASQYAQMFFNELRNRTGGGTMLVNETTFEDLLEEWTDNAGINYDQAYFEICSYIQTAGKKIQNTHGTHDYLLANCSHFGADVTYRFDDEIELTNHSGNPANQVQTSPAASGFSAAHTTAYQSHSIPSPSNTPSKPAGWSVPSVDLQELLRYSSAFMYLTFTKVPGGYTNRNDLEQAQAATITASEALQMFYDGEGEDAIWEYLWSEIPAGDVAVLRDHYKAEATTVAAKP